MVDVLHLMKTYQLGIIRISLEFIFSSYKSSYNIFIFSGHIILSFEIIMLTIVFILYLNAHSERDYSSGVLILGLIQVFLKMFYRISVGDPFLPDLRKVLLRVSMNLAKSNTGAINFMLFTKLIYWIT